MIAPAAASSDNEWLMEVGPALDAAHKGRDCATLETIQRTGAEAGVAVAQHLLGVFYVSDFCNQNYAEAMKWFRRASDQGAALVSAAAEFQIGKMYARGKGVSRNAVEASKWFLRSAEHGDAEAQFEMGLKYSSGHGVPEDYVLAHMWFNLAAASDWGGNTVARDKLNELAPDMTSAQIAEAQRLAREWKPKAFSSWWPWD
jgi:TPR repeat protein